MNWRKPVLRFLLNLKDALAGSPSATTRYYDEILKTEFSDRETIERIQRQRLEKLLLHCHAQVPYYRPLLEECGVVQGGKVDLSRFSEIPFLTKEIMREHPDDLLSRNRGGRRIYHNTSGGSTGEPIDFVQDNLYRSMNWATALFYNHALGKELGDREVKLWGSERDILKGGIGWNARATNFLYNRLLLNSFRMSAEDLRGYVEKINRFKPVSMWAYVDSAFQLARFVRQHDLPVNPIPSTIVTAGTLTEEIREEIETALGTKVFNQYGSREVGPVAAECKHQSGLHLFEWSQLVELVDTQGVPVAEGQIGEVAITLLSNFSMPLLRYRIGDTAVATNTACSCGRQTRLLASVTGRLTDYFVRRDGTLVHGEYFTHLFYHRGWVRRFQTVQEDYDHVVHHLELSQPPREEEEAEIRQRTRAVMGEDCRVEFCYPLRILPSSSGKYLYTYSKVGR